MANQTKRRRTRPSPRSSRSGQPSPWKWIGFLVPLAAVLVVIVIGNISGEPESDLNESSAPGFTLPATNGATVALEELLVDGDTLLYFSMGVGCDGCFAQIPEAAAGLAAEGINLVPVMVDPPDRVATEALRFGITSPILIDRDRAVSNAYGMLGVYGHTDRPSHSFALVHGDWTIGWVKHYATMFVPLEQLLIDMNVA